jgi:hypothetical protein
LEIKSIENFLIGQRTSVGKSVLGVLSTYALSDSLFFDVLHQFGDQKRKKNI